MKKEIRRRFKKERKTRSEGDKNTSVGGDGKRQGEKLVPLGKQDRKPRP